MKKPKKKNPSRNQVWMNHIKKILPVTYISFVQKGQEWFLKVIMKNGKSDGTIEGKDTVMFQVLTNVMEDKEWKYIVESLENKSYERETDVRELPGEQGTI